MNEKDKINPKYYKDMEISPNDYNKANKLEFREGNIVKYISRYKNKNGVEDLKKAMWYLQDIMRDFEIEN